MTKALSEAETRKRLLAAGLTTDRQLIAGLKTGATINALLKGSSFPEGVFLRYMALVDRLTQQQPDVKVYRHRIICGHNGVTPTNRIGVSSS
jgi:hypothetical protein